MDGPNGKLVEAARLRARAEGMLARAVALDRRAAADIVAGATTGNPVRDFVVVLLCRPHAKAEELLGDLKRRFTAAQGQAAMVIHHRRQLMFHGGPGHMPTDTDYVPDDTVWVGKVEGELELRIKERDMHLPMPFCSQERGSQRMIEAMPAIQTQPLMLHLIAVGAFPGTEMSEAARESYEFVIGETEFAAWAVERTPGEIRGVIELMCESDAPVPQHERFAAVLRDISADLEKQKLLNQCATHQRSVDETETDLERLRLKAARYGLTLPE